MVQWNRKISLPKSKRWLGIAAGVVVLAVVGMPLLAKWNHRHQEEAIARLKELGALVELDSDRNVTTLRIMKGTSLETLNYLGALPRLQRLHLPLTDIGDDDLARVGKAQSLEELILSGNQRLTDEGLKGLASLPHLRELFMTDVPIDGSGLKYLSQLPHLEVLDIAQSKVTNLSLESVGRLSHLRFLNVSATGLSNDGLGHLRDLKGLENLVVIGTAITTDGGDELQKSLPKLQITYRL